MAFNPAPSSWVAGWSEDATTLSIPLASFPEITAAEADGTTGDIRNSLYAMCHKFNAAYALLATADKPVRLVVSSSSTLLSTGDIKRTYTFAFTLTPSGIEVATEPV